MYYPGDRVPFLISLARADGAEPDVTSAPRITIVNTYDNQALDLDGVGVKTAAMMLIDGSDALYSFVWDTGGILDGTYVALVGYASDGVTVNGRLFGTVQLGDSRVRGEVALAANAARRTDLPDKDAVMLKTDFVQPADDLSIQAILAKTAALPENVASAEAVASVAALAADLHGVALGTWTINRNVVPNRLALHRLDGTVLAEYDLTNNGQQSARTRR